MPRWTRSTFKRTRAAAQTAVLVQVPEAEPLVGAWRLQHTYDAPLGIPPHVTLLVPFVPVEELRAEVEERLARVLGAIQPFDVTFRRTARFTDVLYLEPDPSEPFSALTEAIAAEWPEHPPYEGAHEVVIPHLTIAEGEDEELFERIKADVEPKLPLRSHVNAALLYEEDAAGRWHEHSRLHLAP
jgi:2'-5' RNA ligase